MTVRGEQQARLQAAERGTEYTRMAAMVYAFPTRRRTSCTQPGLRG